MAPMQNPDPAAHSELGSLPAVLGSDIENESNSAFNVRKSTSTPVRKQLFRTPGPSTAKSRPRGTPTTPRNDSITRRYYRNTPDPATPNNMRTPSRKTPTKPSTARRRLTVAKLASTPLVRMKYPTRNPGFWRSLQVDYLKVWLNAELVDPAMYSSSLLLNNLAKSAVFLKQVSTMVHLYKSETVQQSLEKVDNEIRERRFYVNRNVDLRAHVEPREKLASLLLLNYQPVWLLVGLCAVLGHNFGTRMDAASRMAKQMNSVVESERVVMGALEDVIIEHLIREEYSETEQKDIDDGTPGGGRYGKRSTATGTLGHNGTVLSRVLHLILLLDQAKQKLDPIISSDPPLFRYGSQMTSSEDVLLYLAKHFLQAQGNVTRYLAVRKYSVSYVTPLFERASNLLVTEIPKDLIDGTRLVKLASLLTKDRRMLLDVKRVRPDMDKKTALSIHLKNISLALNRMSNYATAHVFRSFTWAGTNLDFVNGEVDKTVDMLWQMATLWTEIIILDKGALRKELECVQQEFRDSANEASIAILSPSGGTTVEDFALRESSPTNLQVASNCSSVASGLLLGWCATVAGIYGVRVYDFCESFRDGTALCVTLHHYCPNLIGIDEIVRVQQAELRSVHDSEAEHEFVQKNFDLFRTQSCSLGTIPDLPISPGEALADGSISNEKVESFGRAIELLLSYLFRRVVMEKDAREDTHYVDNYMNERLLKRKEKEQAARVLAGVLMGKKFRSRNRLETLRQAGITDDPHDPAQTGERFSHLLYASGSTEDEKIESLNERIGKPVRTSFPDSERQRMSQMLATQNDQRVMLGQHGGPSDMERAEGMYEDQDIKQRHAPDVLPKQGSPSAMGSREEEVRRQVAEVSTAYGVHDFTRGSRDSSSQPHVRGDNWQKGLSQKLVLENTQQTVHELDDGGSFALPSSKSYQAGGEARAWPSSAPPEQPCHDGSMRQNLTSALTEDGIDDSRRGINSAAPRAPQIEYGDQRRSSEHFASTRVRPATSVLSIDGAATNVVYRPHEYEDDGSPRSLSLPLGGDPTGGMPRFEDTEARSDERDAKTCDPMSSERAAAVLPRRRRLGSQARNITKQYRDPSAVLQTAVRGFLHRHAFGLLTSTMSGAEQPSCIEREMIADVDTDLQERLLRDAVLLQTSTCREPSQMISRVAALGSQFSGFFAASRDYISRMEHLEKEAAALVLQKAFRKRPFTLQLCTLTAAKDEAKHRRDRWKRLAFEAARVAAAQAERSRQVAAAVMADALQEASRAYNHEMDRATTRRIETDAIRQLRYEERELMYQSLSEAQMHDSATLQAELTDLRARLEEVESQVIESDGVLEELDSRISLDIPQTPNQAKALGSPNSTRSSDGSDNSSTAIHDGVDATMSSMSVELQVLRDEGSKIADKLERLHEEWASDIAKRDDELKRWRGVVLKGALLLADSKFSLHMADRENARIDEARSRQELAEKVQAVRAEEDLEAAKVTNFLDELEKIDDHLETHLEQEELELSHHLVNRSSYSSCSRNLEEDEDDVFREWVRSTSEWESSILGFKKDCKTHQQLVGNLEIHQAETERWEATLHNRISEIEEQERRGSNESRSTTILEEVAVASHGNPSSPRDMSSSLRKSGALSDFSRKSIGVEPVSSHEINAALPRSMLLEFNSGSCDSPSRDDSGVHPADVRVGVENRPKGSSEMESAILHEDSMDSVRSTLGEARKSEPYSPSEGRPVLKPAGVLGGPNGELNPIPDTDWTLLSEETKKRARPSLETTSRGMQNPLSHLRSSAGPSVASTISNAKLDKPAEQDLLSPRTESREMVSSAALPAHCIAQKLPSYPLSAKRRGNSFGDSREDRASPTPSVSSASPYQEKEEVEFRSPESEDGIILVTQRQSRALDNSQNLGTLLNASTDGTKELTKVMPRDQPVCVLDAREVPVKESPCSQNNVDPEELSSSASSTSKPEVSSEDRQELSAHCSPIRLPVYGVDLEGQNDSSNLVESNATSPSPPRNHVAHAHRSPLPDCLGSQRSSMASKTESSPGCNETRTAEESLILVKNSPENGISIGNVRNVHKGTSRNVGCVRNSSLLAVPDTPSTSKKAPSDIASVTRSSARSLTPADRATAVSSPVVFERSEDNGDFQDANNEDESVSSDAWTTQAFINRPANPLEALASIATHAAKVHSSFAPSETQLTYSNGSPEQRSQADGRSSHAPYALWSPRFGQVSLCDAYIRSSPTRFPYEQGSLPEPQLSERLCDGPFAPLPHELRSPLFGHDSFGKLYASSPSLQPAEDRYSFLDLVENASCNAIEVRESSDSRIRTPLPEGLSTADPALHKETLKPLSPYSALQSDLDPGQWPETFIFADLKNISPNSRKSALSDQFLACAEPGEESSELIVSSGGLESRTHGAVNSNSMSIPLQGGSSEFLSNDSKKSCSPSGKTSSLLVEKPGKSCLPALSTATDVSGSFSAIHLAAENGPMRSDRGVRNLGRSTEHTFRDSDKPDRGAPGTVQRLSQELDQYKFANLSQSDFADLMEDASSAKKVTNLLRRVSQVVSPAHRSAQRAVDGSEQSTQETKGATFNIIRTVLVLIRKCARTQGHIALVEYGLAIIRDMCADESGLPELLRIEQSVEVLVTCVQFYRDCEVVLCLALESLCALSLCDLGRTLCVDGANGTKRLRGVYDALRQQHERYVKSCDRIRRTEVIQEALRDRWREQKSDVSLSESIRIIDERFPPSMVALPKSFALFEQLFKQFSASY